MPKKLSRSLCVAETIECFFIFYSLECFSWKRPSYCTGPRNALLYCTCQRKHIPGETTFASWSPLKKYIWQPFCFSTSTEQTAKLENLQNASQNKYTKLRLKTNTCNLFIFIHSITFKYTCNSSNIQRTLCRL